MSSAFALPMPVQRALRQLGGDINRARRRRRIAMSLMAERAGIARATLAKIEKGDSTVSLGGYASVLFVLGFTDRLMNLADAAQDRLGLELQDETLPQRIRMPRRSQKRKT